MRVLATARSTWQILATTRGSQQVGIRLSSHEPLLNLRAIRSIQSRCLTTTSRLQSSWNTLIDATHEANLRNAYPHIEAPTPAQQALMKALEGDKDIFLRDRMGRGKTFGLALSSIHQAKKGLRVMILVPTPQLLDLIQTHLDNLSTGSSLDVDSSIWLTTPKNALSDPRVDRFSPDIIMIDEPETLLQPLPPRHLQGGALRSHPFNKHPPPLATLLHHLAQLGTNASTRMVWVGAEMNGLLKRTVRHRGWAGLDALELDFEGSSARSFKDIDSLAGSSASEGPVESREVEHLPFLVGVDGMTPYIPDEGVRDLPPHHTGRPIIEDTMIQAVVRYQAEHPISDGTTTIMILPPEGYPLDLLATRLTTYASTAKIPMSITNIIPTASQIEPNSILITPRSAVPGLDIPNLSRIILLNGLDLAGLSPAQRSRGGVKKRAAFYDVICGRLGRLGSVTHEKGGQVVSFVTEGSGEEVGLGLVMTQKSRRKPHDSDSIDSSPSYNSMGE